MIIRDATTNDWKDIKRLMVDFANFNPVEDLRQPEYNERHTDSVLFTLSKQGMMLVAEDNERVVGMLLASLIGDTWLPHIVRMVEVAWWVETDYRKTTAGARLLKEYIARGVAMKEAGTISSFTLTTLATTPDLKLQDRGWEVIDYNWIYRG
jgi:N-acetylglutamate synthase-like GNAT family acetyltransferase